MWAAGDSGVWFSVTSFPADNFVVEILAWLCVWTQRASRSTDIRCVGVCKLLSVCPLLNLCLCVCGRVVVGWNQALPIMWYAFAGQPWVTVIFNPQRQRSRFFTLCLWFLFLLNSLWVRCIQFHVFFVFFTLHNFCIHIYCCSNHNPAVGVARIKGTVCTISSSEVKKGIKQL